MTVFGWRAWRVAACRSSILYCIFYGNPHSGRAAQTQWLMYWILNGLFVVFEEVFDFAVSSIPTYYEQGIIGGVVFTWVQWRILCIHASWLHG